MVQAFRTWWQRQTGEDVTPLDGDSSAFFVSLAFHLCLLVGLGMVPIVLQPEKATVVVSSVPEVERKEDLKVPEEFYFSELPSDEIGANSEHGVAAALSMAAALAEVSIIPRPVDQPPTDVEHPQIEINNIVARATGTHYSENLAVKGAAGEGTTGAAGAIDRLTHEILLSLEERKTLVVWLFDQTASLLPQRRIIRERFEKIHAELGIIASTGNEAFTKHDDRPLLSSVIAFGSGMHLMTRQPTDDLDELKKAVADIPSDDTGTENTFTAILEAAKRYAEHRYTTKERPTPERNVMLIVFTDEAGDDQNRAEEALKMCRRWTMPVYVVGVPAPFGRRETELKWVDPDPKYNQTPRPGVVDQGPESCLPEVVKLSFQGDKRADDTPIDSGFGPFALTRLCYETGGIYFAVHPNRNVNRAVSWREIDPYSAHLKYFFDPEVMRKYRPEYISIGEYQKRLNQNKSRRALIEAANASQLDQMDNPTLKFVKTEEAEFAKALSTAQQKAAALEPKINALYEILRQGEADREKETALRWQVGYDLAMGRVLAVKIRTETYNAMLASAKRGLKPKDPKNNTWTLVPADEITVGSQYAKVAERAKMYLERVAKNNEGTPWAMLAQRELSNKLGWAWEESFTDTTPPPKQQARANPNPPPAKARKPQKQMLPPPETRPVPKKL